MGRTSGDVEKSYWVGKGDFQYISQSRLTSIDLPICGAAIFWRLQLSKCTRISSSTWEEKDLTRRKWVFPEASQGTKKEYFLNAVQNCLKSFRSNVISAAASTLEITILKDGSTVRSDFKNSATCGVEDTCYISVDSNEAKKLRDVSLDILDEIVMCHHLYIKNLDFTLKTLCRTRVSFVQRFCFLLGTSGESFLGFCLAPWLRFLTRALGHQVFMKNFKLFDFLRTRGYSHFSKAPLHQKKQ